MSSRACHHTRNSEITREVLLAAAEAVFAREGYEGARVETIAAEAGYTRALIFHYFTDKAGLYQAVVQRQHRTLSTESTRAIGALLPSPEIALTDTLVRDVLKAAISWTFDYYAQHRSCLRLLAWEAAEEWSTFPRADSPGEAALWANGVADLIVRAQRSGFIRPELDPVLLMATIHGAALSHFISAPRYQAMFSDVDLTSAAAHRRARDHAIEIVLHGIMTSPERY